MELIKVKLTERSLSPRQLSLDAGLSPGYVSKVLGGMSPSLGAFAALVEVLKEEDLQYPLQLYSIILKGQYQ